VTTRALIDHIVLLAGDITASAAWYDAFLGVLGFRKTRAHVYLSPDDWVVDLRAASDSAEPYGRYNVGLNHIGLRVEDANAVLAVRDAFAAKGFAVAEPEVFKGKVTAVFFTDPDGMCWEIGHEISALL
jgi:catechol 2,3-dioxygenase-like lactoylglutathione lyase family enzyme